MAELNSTGMDASMADESRINRLTPCSSKGARTAGGSLALRGDHVPVPGEGRLRRAPLGGLIHVNQAEPLVEAFTPLEVVGQRPLEVAAHIDACGHRLVHRLDVPVQVVDPALIGDGP